MVARNIKLRLTYDGTNYVGWQRQRAQPTIQETLEEALARMTGERIVLHGAGRTDAGVHALGMVASFQTASAIPLVAFERGLNSMLPPDIRIMEATEMPLSFHARFSASGKIYGYRFTTAPIMPPCDRLYVAHFPGPCDFAALRAALPALLGEHDFSCFEATGSRPAESRRGAVRCIRQLELVEERERPGFYEIIVAGDGFLRHMVRNMVGTLIEVGRGRRSPDSLAALLAAGDRSAAGPTAPACGLTLKEVLYFTKNIQVKHGNPHC